MKKEQLFKNCLNRLVEGAHFDLQDSSWPVPRCSNAFLSFILAILFSLTVLIGSAMFGLKAGQNQTSFEAYTAASAWSGYVLHSPTFDQCETFRRSGLCGTRFAISLQKKSLKMQSLPTKNNHFISREKNLSLFVFYGDPQDSPFFGNYCETRFTEMSDSRKDIFLDSNTAYEFGIQKGDSILVDGNYFYVSNIGNPVTDFFGGANGYVYMNSPVYNRFYEPFDAIYDYLFISPKSDEAAKGLFDMVVAYSPKGNITSSASYETSKEFYDGYKNNSTIQVLKSKSTLYFSIAILFYWASLAIVILWVVLAHQINVGRLFWAPSAGAEPLQFVNLRWFCYPYLLFSLIGMWLVFFDIFPTSMAIFVNSFWKTFFLGVLPFLAFLLVDLSQWFYYKKFIYDRPVKESGSPVRIIEIRL